MTAIRIDKCPRCGAVLRERSTEQNSALHAAIADIAEQKQWAGQHLDPEAWKRLLIAAWERANKRSAEIYPALDGAGFDLVYRRSSRLSKPEMSDLLEYVKAWATTEGVVLHDQEMAA